ncbi:MAG: DNA-directed RNA polymerase subunit H [Candidatus Aenigmatarchaeota archaeon]|nr:MAG: DNA-directed RNA polymerase subunit H [Candidatus Aenigmarchaeota archaeon]
MGDFIVEIVNHELVPKHEILTEKEKKEVMQKFEVNESQLPKIPVSDPVIEIVGAKPGNVVKITRRSETAEEAVYYRLVVKG